MMNKFRIGKVDIYGLNGRDFHPEPSDEGLLVTPVKMEVLPASSLDDLKGLTPSALQALLMVGDAFIIYTCVTNNGRVLELADYELEAV